MVGEGDWCDMIWWGISCACPKLPTKFSLAYVRTCTLAQLLQDLDQSMVNIEQLTLELDLSFESDPLLTAPHPYVKSIIEGKCLWHP